MGIAREIRAIADEECNEDKDGEEDDDDSENYKLVQIEESGAKS